MTANTFICGATIEEGVDECLCELCQPCTCDDCQTPISYDRHWEYDGLCAGCARHQGTMPQPGRE